MSKRSLLNRWLGRKKESPTPEAQPPGGPYPLSAGQRRLWILNELTPDNPFYHYAEAYALGEELQPDTLRRAFDAVAARHDILRTTFHRRGEEVVQVVDRDAGFDWVAEEWGNSAVDERLIAFARQPFKLQTGPLARVLLLRRTTGGFILLVVLHHAVTDAESLRILRREVSHAYQRIESGEPIDLPALPLQYGDYAARQPQAGEESLDYWVEKLRGGPQVLPLPLDRRRPDLPSYRGRLLEGEIAEELARTVRNRCREQGVTPFVYLLTVYFVLLRRYSGQDDLVVGAPISNRDRPELEQLIGFFNETVALRNRVEGNLTFNEVLGNVRQTLLESFAHKNVAFDEIVGELQLPRRRGVNPVFQVMFVLKQEAEVPRIAGEVPAAYRLLDLGITKFDLTLHVTDRGESFGLLLEYATDLFGPERMKRMLKHYELILRQATARPDAPVDTFELVSAAAYRSARQDCFTPAGPTQPARVDELIGKCIQESPLQTAIYAGSHSLSYSELGKRAAVVAERLVTAGVAPGAVVGLYAARTTDAFTGLYAVLLAGGAYLPLDPAYPVQRLAHMLRDSGASALLFAGELPNELLAGEVDAISLAEHESGAVLDVFPSRATVSSPAYLIYTSGSSGKPKGVAVSHRQLAASTAARREFYRAGPPVFLLLSSLSFDSSVAGIFHCLTTGGSLVITKERAEQDVGRLAALIAERGVTMTLMLPPLYHQLLDFADPWQLRSLRTVIVAGQSCPADLVARHFQVLPHTELVNEYGPTETTVWATAYRCRPQDAEGEVPIGRPVPGYGILLTDVAGRLCPPGIAGEICIAGAGVADGYWRDRELTAEKFVDLRLPDGSVERVYRSGDLGSWREDGQLLFLGRKDRQVKVRGYRIELEEVRRAVLDLPGVEDAEVITNPEGTLLEAYLQCGRRRAGAGEYRDQLKESLPAHMVPARLIHLDDFPRLPNGKVDRASLRQHAPKPGTEAENRPDPPQTERERILLGIWRELLRAPNIGVTDNFFASGGDSIVSIRLLARARERGLSFPPTAIFDRQTVRELAAVSRTTGSLLAEPSVEDYQGRTPLTPIQQWFFAEHRTAPHHWNQAWLVTADISTDPERLKQAVHTIWKRNEGLRQRFVRTKEGWAGEIYAGTDELSLSRLFHTSTGTVEEQLEQFHREAELSEGGLFRVAMVDPKSSGNTLLFWAHHLVVDAVSWHTLFTDLMRLLGQEEERSPGMRLAYHQWPLFLQRLAREGKHGPELDYWREQTDTALPTDFTVRLPVRESSARTLSGKSSPAATSAFLTDANRAFNTRPEEVLLAATVLALAEWTGSPEHTLMLERHGRDTPGSELAVEETIGWFTRTFPLHFRVPEHQDETEILILVKEQLRAVPNKGIGYGLLRYFTEDSGLDQQPAVYFNYLGQRGEAPDGIAEVRFLRGGMRHPEGERLRMLEINAEVENGQLHIHLTFSEELHREATIRAFLDQLIAALDGLIDRCRSREETTLTPSDFPDSGLGQDELNELFGEIDGL